MYLRERSVFEPLGRLKVKQLMLIGKPCERETRQKWIGIKPIKNCNMVMGASKKLSMIEELFSKKIFMIHTLGYLIFIRRKNHRILQNREN